MDVVVGIAAYTILALLNWRYIFTSVWLSEPADSFKRKKWDDVVGCLVGSFLASVLWPLAFPITFAVNWSRNTHLTPAEFAQVLLIEPRKEKKTRKLKEARARIGELEQELKLGEHAE